MKVLISNYAWFDKSEMHPSQIAQLKQVLTVVPRKSAEFGDEEVQPILLYEEKDGMIGVAREYFLGNRSRAHDLEWDLSNGSMGFPFPIKFNGKLRPEQEEALVEVAARFRAGQLGGTVNAPCSWGKTVWTCALIAELGLPTLVVVHKEFLMDQWKERIAEFLPEALVGHVQQDTLDYVGKHVVLGMVHTLAARDFSNKFWRWPGFVITDECHRIGAYTWSPVPGKSNARHRLGLSATLRRKDGAEAVFEYQIGPILFRAKERRMVPKIRRVYTNFRLVKTPNFNPALAPRSLIIRFMTANPARNKTIAEQLILAVKAGRKPLVLSERLNHLDRIQKATLELWDSSDGPPPTFGKYVGGKSKNELASARKQTVVLATTQYAQEGLDIPELDTLFLTTPLSDVEQAVGRILRFLDGKKDPIVVDFRDDNIPMFKKMSDYREVFYSKVA